MHKTDANWYTQLLDFRQVSLWQQAIAAIAYFGLAYLSNLAVDPVSGFSAIWLPTGVSVGLIYIWGYPTWLGSLLGVLLTQAVLYNGLATLTDALLTILIITIGTIGTLLGVYGTTALTHKRYILGHARDTTAFIICNCFLSPLFAAVLTPLLLCLLGKFAWAYYLPLALSLWMGDAFAIMTVTPLIMAWHHDASIFKRLLHQQPVEGMLIVFLMLVVSQIAFSHGYPVAYLVVPLILWAAFRFGEVGATLLMVGIAAISIIGTIHNRSLFAQSSLSSSLTLLQSFIAFISITTLIVSAVLNENNRAKADLKQTNAMLNQFLNALPVGVSVHSPDGTALYMNPMAEQLLQSSQIHLNQSMKTAQSGEQNLIYRAGTNTLCPPEQLPISRALKGEYLLDDDLEIRHPDRTIPLEVQGTPILDEQGAVTSAIAVLQDITERKRTEAILANYTHELEQEVSHRTRELASANQQLQREIQQRERAQAALHDAVQALQQLVNLDGLTRIANRRCFDERLQQEWQKSVREQRPLALILLDVDYFKRYNDFYGHQAGDECLVKVAQAAAQAVKRSDDLVARYGGEEFVIILPNTDQNGAVRVAQRLQNAIRDLAIAHAQSEVSQTVTISMGIAQIVPQLDGSTDALVHLADQALYQAKQLGRNRYVVVQS
ncbi:MAG: sensor domain-containing diguanylate cyclase [Thainema sp.]